MSKVNLYTIGSTKVGDFNLPVGFVGKVNLPLLAQAVRIYEEISHPGLVKVKTRGEVDRTTKKVYKQKGTGGARHGSRSAPIYVGGGKAHGPRPLRRELVISQKMGQAALVSALSAKIEDKKLAVVAGLGKTDKTNKIGKFLKGLKLSKRFLIVLGNNNNESAKFIRNLENVTSLLYKDLNAYVVYRGGTILLDEDIFAAKKEEKKEVVKKEVVKTVKKVVKKAAVKPAKKVTKK